MVPRRWRLSCLKLSTLEGLRAAVEPATVDAEGWHDTGAGPGSTEGDFVDWLTIGDNEKSVCADVQRIRSHPLVPNSIPIYGYIYDVKTGRLIEVPAATSIGAAA